MNRYPIGATGRGAMREDSLHGFLTAVFVQMAGSVAVSAAAALLVERNAILQSALVGPDGMTVAGWIVLLAPLALVIILGAGVERLSGPAARLLLFVYATLVGLSLGTMLLGISDAAVLTSFGAAAAGFAALALVGGRAGRDLSGLGSFLTVGLVGLLVALLANLLLRSTGLDLLLAALGVLLFAGLTAYDTQRLKRLYLDTQPRADGSVAVLGALTLYLDFLNLFVSLLRLSGRRR